MEFLWGDTITALAQDEAGVDVTFAQARPARFDVVIGADGLHSTVRRLVFGPEVEFLRHAGMYVATLPIDAPFGDDSEVVIYNTPGRAVHPTKGHALAAFIFRRDAVPGYHHRDLDQHKRLVDEAFADGSWRLPQLLDQVHAADDLHFDSISRVRLPRWSTGRIGLVGDAAAAVSLFGDGTTLAIAGAYRLAEELSQSRPTSRRPSAGMRPATGRWWTRNSRDFVSPGPLLPGTRPGIALRNTAAHLVSAAAGIGRGHTASRLPRRRRVL